MRKFPLSGSRCALYCHKNNKTCCRQSYTSNPAAYPAGVLRRDPPSPMTVPPCRGCQMPQNVVVMSCVTASKIGVLKTRHIHRSCVTPSTLVTSRHQTTPTFSGALLPTISRNTVPKSRFYYFCPLSEARKVKGIRGRDALRAVGIADATFLCSPRRGPTAGTAFLAS